MTVLGTDKMMSEQTNQEPQIWAKVILQVKTFYYSNLDVEMLKYQLVLLKDQKANIFKNKNKSVCEIVYQMFKYLSTFLSRCL